MSDYELYGDYNEIDEPPTKSKSSLIIKIIALVICFSVIGLLGFRLIIFGYYPQSMKTLYFTPTLTAYYNENDGEIEAFTQSLRAPYDDADKGNFFCDNLIVIPEIDQVQVSLRYNVSLADTLKEKYGVDFDVDDTSVFKFSLRRSGGDENATGADAGVAVECTLAAVEWDSFMMYRYCKLVFDGVDLGEGSDKVEWLRLDVTIDGVERDEPFMICIYENNDAYSKTKDYVPSAKEKP